MKKEQRELETLEKEDEARRAGEQARKDADARFRARAKMSKRKLEAYYAALKQEAEREQDRCNFPQSNANQSVNWPNDGEMVTLPPLRAPEYVSAHHAEAGSPSRMESSPLRPRKERQLGKRENSPEPVAGHPE